MRQSEWATLAAVSVAIACGPTEATDAGTFDAASPDSAVSPDAGPELSAFCDPCRRDTDCGDGSLCLFLDDGERACGWPCMQDSDCSRLTLVASCEVEGEGLPSSCRPIASTCIVTPAGTACADSAACQGTYNLCVGGVCTLECAIDADCPIGLRRCRDTTDGRVCVFDELSPPERCRELVAAGDATRCELDRSCPGGGSCFGADLSLCLMNADAGCPVGTIARPSEPGSIDEVCVPSAPSFEGWDALLGPDCDCVLSDGASMLEEALALAGRDRCAMGFPRAPGAPLGLLPPELMHDRFRLSWTDRAHGYWPASLAMGRRLAANLDAATEPSAVLREAARWADLRQPGPPASDSSTLANALESLVAEAGGGPDRATIDRAVDALPSAITARLIPIVDAIAGAVRARELAIATLDPAARDTFFDSPSLSAIDPGFDPPYAAVYQQGVLLGEVDVGLMSAHAIHVLETVEAARLDELSSLSASLIFDTPAGRIAIRGGSDDTYEGDVWEETLLLIDLSGDDTYRAPAGATATTANGVSVVIDVSGSDTYGYDAVGITADDGPPGHRRLPSDGAGRNASAPWSSSMISRQGAGRLGIGLLLDLGTERDTYRSLRMSQGYGALGVGVLYDAGGDDLYEAEAGAQGAASFGVGILIDARGNDEYVAYHAAQGYAYVRAVGILYDRDGDDIYFAHPDDVLYPSIQDPGSNNSHVQGASRGRRGDLTGDGVYLSGGLGVLRDRAGSDGYTAGVFAQATGFWFGAGMLLEGGGDDRYDGSWYAQAGAAHFAIAVFVDEGGADEYNILSGGGNLSLGTGHDFSIAWFVDQGGADTYRSMLGLGAGTEAGAGIFADLAGIDAYDSTDQRGFGWASISEPIRDTIRVMSGTLGIFLEANGADAYVRPTVAPVANDSTFMQSTNGPTAGEHGIGIDRTGGRTGLE